jgi:hypothetical protein
MDFFESLAELEATPDLHCARLLVLLNAFAGEDGTREIEGLTKLAKLDFLLRYPVMLEKALQARNRSAKAAEVQPHERNSVESKMVRYRYGPWDHRYWQFLALLQAKGLVRVRRKGLGRMVGLTETGRALAGQLSQSADFNVVARRAHVLKESLDLTATGIMRFVYATFPEIASLQMNEPIES